MRHYFGYNQDGVLVSTEMMGGGWPEDHKLEHHDSPHDVVKGVRERRLLSNPEVSGFVAYECGCPTSKGSCACCVSMKHNGMVVNGELVLKPHPAIFVDGQKLDLSATTKGLDGAPVYELI